MDELLDWIGLSTFFAKLKTLFVTTESRLQKNYQKVMLKKGETYVAPYTFADQVSFSDGDTFQNKYDSGELTGPQGPKGDTGAKGATGATPAISATATVDANVGTPSVTVTKSGTTASPSFAFAFKNLKGATGSKGDPGRAGTRGSIWYRGTAITGTSTTPTIFSGSGVSSALVNDMYLNTSTGYVYTCTLAGSPTVAKWVYSGSIKGPTGAKGADGLTTSVTVNGTKYTQSNGNVTLPNYPTSLKNPNALTISLNGTSQGGYDGSAQKSINITAPSVGAISKWAVQLTNEDLNDIKVDIGFYYGAGGNTVANTPKDGSAFGLRCERTAGGYYLQTYTVNYNAQQYQRFFDGSNAKWSNWLKVYSEAQKPIPAEIGAAAATHTHNYAGASTPGGAANSASKLATPRKIAGVSFDGTADISIPYANLTGKPTIPEGVEVIDNLTSTSKTASLSANMGKQLNDTKAGLPNLLDNSNFLNPVNQRMSQDFIAQGTCIDRWKLWASNNQQALSVRPQGIQMKGQLYQIIPNETAPVGGTYTFSVKIRGREIISVTGFETAKTFNDITLTIGKDVSGVYTQVTITTTNNTLFFEWAKLEKGTIRTLYVPKNYSTELNECLRYFQFYTGIGFRAVSPDQWSGYITFPLLTKMRINPTCTVVRYTYKSDNVTDVQYVAYDNVVRIQIFAPAGQPMGVNVEIQLSAEL